MVFLIGCHLVEVIHMFCSRTFKPYVVILIVSLLLAALLQCKYKLQFTTFVMLMTVLITIINNASNLFMVEFNLKLDGYGCPFTFDQAVNTSHACAMS